MTNTMNLDQTYIAETYKRFPVEIVSGKGSVVYDSDGKSYIDMGSGIGVTSFGIADSLWQQAIIEQIGKVQHMSNLYYTQPCAQLAELLCQNSGLKRVFFSNSGAEANECAIKIARKYSSDKYGPDRHTIITLQNSFHGRTLATLAATGQDHFHKLFQPLPTGFVSVPANDLSAIQRAASDCHPAAVIIECIQGEGGVHCLDASYIKALRDYTEANDILLIVDEVQTGNGRTGMLYSYMHFGITPDLVSTAKGLAGGLPLGAVLIGDKCQHTLSYGDHGSTFGGNPVCCAAALSILRRLDQPFLESVRAKGDLIRSTLTGQPGIESVSGLGLMVGIKTTKPAADVVSQCLSNGVLCLTAKDKVRLLPALNIPTDLLQQALSVILSACR